MAPATPPSAAPASSSPAPQSKNSSHAAEPHPRRSTSPRMSASLSYHPVVPHHHPRARSQASAHILHHRLRRREVDHHIEPRHKRSSQRSRHPYSPSRPGHAPHVHAAPPPSATSLPVLPCPSTRILIPPSLNPTHLHMLTLHLTCHPPSRAPSIAASSRWVGMQPRTSSGNTPCPSIAAPPRSVGMQPRAFRQHRKIPRTQL